MPEQFHAIRSSSRLALPPTTHPYERGREGAGHLQRYKPSVSRPLLQAVGAGFASGCPFAFLPPIGIWIPFGDIPRPPEPEAVTAATAVGGLPLTASERKRYPRANDGAAHALIEISLSPLPPSALPMPAFPGAPSGVAANCLTLHGQVGSENRWWI